MNNRNPFIPNIPTAQGGWGDPHQIYSQNHSFNNGTASHLTSSGGSGSGQTNVQMQFSTQQQLQGSHGQWYTTQTGASIPLTTLPLQATTGSIFWDDGQPSVNLNSGVQVNYTTYQNSNSGGYQQQQQQQIISSQQSPANVVHQIVTQQPRVVPLNLDASHFVHFPVNLSPPAGMVSIPMSMNSRSSNSSSPGASMSPIRNEPLSLSSRNVSTPMSVHSPSPTSMIEPLHLNVRSSGGNFGNNNSRANISSNLNSNSHFNNNSNSNSNPNLSRMSHQQTNSSRITANHFVDNNSPSPPAHHHVSVPVSRNSRSPAAYSGNSPSHSHSSSPAQMNSRGTSTGGVYNNNNNSSNTLKTHQTPQSNSGNSSSLTINSPSYSPGFPSSLNQRFSPAAVQFLTSAAAASMNLSEATLRQQLALNAAASLSAQNFIVNANTLRLQQQQQHNQQQQHQIAPVAHARSSVPVTPLPFHTRIMEDSSSSASPSPPPPPPPPPKRKRGPAKKREPKKPVAINPMESIRPNFLPSFQHSPQGFQLQRQPPPLSQSPVNRPSVISATPHNRLSTPTGPTAPTTTWNSQPQVSSIPLPTMNPFPLVPTPLPNSMQRMTRPPQPPVNRMTTPTPSTPTKPLSMPSLGSPVITTGSPRMGNPMLSSTAAVSPPKSLSTFSSPTKSPMKPNSKFTSVLDYAMERAGIPSDPAGLQEDMDNSDVFREDEIMKLVGQIPDQTNDLQLLNPLNELRSPEKAKTDVASWEQEALKSASQSGLDDLQFELDRFYCPPSPPKAVAADASAASSLPASDATLTTIGGVHLTTKPPTSSSAKKLTGTADSSSRPSPTKPNNNPIPDKPAAESGDKKKPDSDDDCEVILVKLSTKKRRLVRRIPNPNKPMQGGRGPPPKPGNTGSRGRPIPGRPPPQSRGSQSRVTSGATSSRIVPAPPNPPQQRQPGKRVTRATAGNSIVPTRPALPNGKHLDLTPKLTADIPPSMPASKVRISLRKILSDGSDDESVSKNIIGKGTARKKTGGSGVSVPKIVRIEGGIVMTPPLKSSAPTKGIKSTARKSTAPLPKNLKELYASSKKTSSRSTRGSGRKTEDITLTPEPPAIPLKTATERPKRRARVFHDDDDDDYLKVIETGVPAVILPSCEDRPPIKLTVSLTESKVVSATAATNSARSKSSKNVTSRGTKSAAKGKRKSGSPKHRSSPLETPHTLESYDTRKREGLRPKSTYTRLLDGNESEEDLQIVQEYLADSDDSFDPNGEKDEASSESESEPEAEDEEIEAFKKIVSVVDPEPKPLNVEIKPEPPKVEPEKYAMNEDEDDPEQAPATPDSAENIPSPSMPEPNDTDDDDALSSNNSPIHNFADESHAQEDEEDMEMESEPGPFTNVHLNKPDSDSEKQGGWSTVLEDAGEPEPPNPESTVVKEKPTTESSDSENEDAEAIVKPVPPPKVFDTPKPQVIIKGTKADADKAVSDMRNALAQLSKFKIPFFGK